MLVCLPTARKHFPQEGGESSRCLLAKVQPSVSRKSDLTHYGQVRMCLAPLASARQRPQDVWRRGPYVHVLHTLLFWVKEDESLLIIYRTNDGCRGFISHFYTFLPPLTASLTCNPTGSSCKVGEWGRFEKKALPPGSTFKNFFTFSFFFFFLFSSEKIKNPKQNGDK